MTAQSSNKDNPTSRGYYQRLADVYRLYWELHKARIAVGETTFAINSEGGDFSMEHEVARQRKFTPSHLRPVHYFEKAVYESMYSSWCQFAGIDGKRATSVLGRLIADDWYVKALLFEVAELSSFAKESTNHLPYDVFRSTNLGIQNAARVTTHLAALFREEFSPLAAVVVSKVSLRHIEEARLGIGLQPSVSIHIEPDYPLVKPDEKTGLDISQLREYGLGRTLGCPAAMDPSDICKGFLERTCGQPQTQQTVVEEFAKSVKSAYKTYVQDWFDPLSQEARATITPNQLMLLEGRVPILQRSTESHCPYSHGERK